MQSISINIFSTKVLIVDTVVTSPTEDGTTISRAHPSRTKGLTAQGKPVPSVILRF